MKMAERALSVMKQSDPFRTWDRNDLREAAGVSIRAAYRLWMQVSELPEVEFSLRGRLKLREDIAQRLHEIQLTSGEE